MTQNITPRTAFLAQFLKNVRSPVLFVVAVAAVIFVGAAGPFGTYWEMTLAERFGFWGVLVLCSTIIAQLVRAGVESYLWYLDYWPRAMILAGLLMLLLTAFLQVLIIGMTSGRDVAEPTLWRIGSTVFAASIFISLVRRLMAAKTPGQVPRLYRRLNVPDGSSIKRVTVRDHYVDVYTDQGEQRLLMRFADALAELDGLPGLQVHRSHWVADAAVLELKNINGRRFLRLHDGSEVPVSRAYCPAVKARFRPLRPEESSAGFRPS